MESRGKNIKSMIDLSLYGRILSELVKDGKGDKSLCMGKETISWLDRNGP